jgi:ATP-dependent helicase/nuclease subunit B
MVRPVGVPTIFCSPRAHERKERALAHLRARRPGAEGLALAGSLDALTDLYAVLAREGRSAFGEHRATLARLAAQIAAPRLAAQELAPAGPLPLEALCARVVAALADRGKLGRFTAVARRPGLPRAIARTLREARSAGQGTAELAAVDVDLATIHEEYEAELVRHGLADRAVVLRTAAARVREGDTPLSRLPLLLFDMPLTPGLEADLVSALAQGSPAVLATVPEGDVLAEEALRHALGAAIERPATETAGSSLERLQEYLFEERPLPRAASGRT